MEVVKTTGDRALDEEINRILARISAAEEGISKLQTPTVVLPRPTRPPPPQVPGVSVEVSGGSEIGPAIVINVIPGTNMDAPTAVLNGDDIDLTLNASAQAGGVSIEVSGGAEVGPASKINIIPGTNMDAPTAVLNGADIDLTLNAVSQGPLPQWAVRNVSTADQPSANDCILDCDATVGGSFVVTLGTQNDDLIPTGKIYAILNSSTGTPDIVSVYGFTTLHAGTYLIANLSPGQAIMTYYSITATKHRIIASH